MQLEDYENFEKTHPSNQAASTASAWNFAYVDAMQHNVIYDQRMLQQWYDAIWNGPANAVTINGIGLDNPQE